MHSKALMLVVMFTMFFSGGIIPTYLMLKNMGFIDNLLVLIIPSAINTTNMIIMRTAFLQCAGQFGGISQDGWSWEFDRFGQNYNTTYFADIRSSGIILCGGGIGMHGLMHLFISRTEIYIHYSWSCGKF